MESVFDFVQSLSHGSLVWALNSLWMGFLLTVLAAAFWRLARNTNARVSL